MNKLEKNIFVFLHHFILIIFAVLWLVPIYLMIIDGLKTTSGVLSSPILLPTGIYLGAFSSVFSALELPMLNSLVIALPTAAISTFIGGMAAYYFYKVNSILNTTLFTIIAVATFIPYEVSIIPLVILLVKLHLFDTYGGLIFSMLVFYLPTGALLMSIFITVLPKTIIESARTDGAGDWSIYSRIVFPLVIPGAISTFIFIFIEAWNNFFIPLVTVSTPTLNTVSLALQFYTGGYGTLYNESFAAALTASLIPLLIFVILGRYFVKGFLALGTGGKG